MGSNDLFTRRALMRAFVLAVMIAPSLASADTAPALHYHKAKFFMDQNGQSWLSIQFVNDGSTSIDVIGIAPDQSGPWTPIKQRVAPGALVRGALKVVKDTSPAVAYLDTSIGLLRFDLAARR